MTDSRPLVSVGLPVYNGQRFVARTLESLLAQDWPALELIVSDNASTDRTRDICLEYAARDGRIRYVRQETNIGACRNFHAVLQLARGEYFMWAGADDWWHRSCVRRNLEVLQSRPDVAASVSRARFEIAGRGVHVQQGTYALMDSPGRNIIRYLRDPALNSRFYGLFRTDVLRRCFDGEVIWAFDLLVVARVLLLGKFFEIDEQLFGRDLTYTSDYLLRLLPQYARGFWRRWFPMAVMTRRILADPRMPHGLGLSMVLLKLNVEFEMRIAIAYAIAAIKRLGRLLGRPARRPEPSGQAPQ